MPIRLLPRFGLQLLLATVCFSPAWIYLILRAIPDPPLIVYNLTHYNVGLMFFLMIQLVLLVALLGGSLALWSRPQ